MSGNRRKALSIDIQDSVEDSFVANEFVFIKDDVAINSNGISLRNNPKSFRLAYEELEIGEILGRGSSSVVVYAKHAPTGTPLALKIINLFDKSKREQLIREINALYDAQNPSLISFYGAFYREGAITIALEYMDGGSMANVLDQVGPIPEFALAGMAYQVLWALAYMKHDKRVHRDVKPSNLLINSNGLVKVSDFGVSAELQNSISMCGTFVGTFKYMSPERIRNHPYSFMSDIWSFGISMMECATGIYPFPETSTCIDMAQTIIEARIPDAITRRITPNFSVFLQHCLHPDPDRRLPAEILLGSPWLQEHGASSLEKSAVIVRSWIDSLSRK